MRQVSKNGGVEDRLFGYIYTRKCGHASMTCAFLEGSGGMPDQENFKFGFFEIASGAIRELKSVMYSNIIM